MWKLKIYSSELYIAFCPDQLVLTWKYTPRFPHPCDPWLCVPKVAIFSPSLFFFSLFLFSTCDDPFSHNENIFNTTFTEEFSSLIRIILILVLAIWCSCMFANWWWVRASVFAKKKCLSIDKESQVFLLDITTQANDIHIEVSEPRFRARITTLSVPPGVHWNLNNYCASNVFYFRLSSHYLLRSFLIIPCFMKPATFFVLLLIFYRASGRRSQKYLTLCGCGQFVKSLCLKLWFRPT